MLKLVDKPASKPAGGGTILVEPEQVGAAGAARMAGVSEATWWRLQAAGKVPRPNRLGGRTLWQVNGPNGLREWIRQGCPARADFESRQKAQHNGQM